MELEKESSSSSEDDENAIWAADNAVTTLKDYLENAHIVGEITGLVYDSLYEGHAHPFSSHPERPARVISIMHALETSGLASTMKRIYAKDALVEDLLLVHDQSHISKVDSLRDPSTRLLLSNDMEMQSVFANEHSVDAAYRSCGGVVELVKAVCDGRVRNGIAVVRPPGHHAECSCVKGFCHFNNVAVAAAWASDRKGSAVDVFDEEDESLKFKRYKGPLNLFKSVNAPCRVLIVDWDVHHGNGTQQAFEGQNNVIYFSVHRWDNGAFYPTGPCGGPNFVGVRDGVGANINVAFNGHGPFGDAEYFEVWSRVLMPAARCFDPDMVIVSAGFDAAAGDHLGGCFVSPNGYGVLLHQLMSLANGRIVLALEGGYSLSALSQSCLVCAAVLQGESPPGPFKTGSPSDDALAAIEATIHAHQQARWLQRDIRSAIFNWLPQAEESTELEDVDIVGFKVQALTWSNSLSEENIGDEIPSINVLESNCGDCGDVVENWMCLKCFQVFCARNRNQHMLEHFQESGHSIAISFSDLSVWDFKEDSYLDSLKIKELHPAFSACYFSKFNQYPSFPPEEVT